jgi:GNAT superfamily N-acetyltransferase
MLAEDGDVAIGVAYLSFTWTLEHGGKSAWLEELYVVPERRGAGVGTQLLERTLGEARARGCHAVDVEVEASHARAAKLYARAGFRMHTRTGWVIALA